MSSIVLAIGISIRCMSKESEVDRLESTFS